MKLQGHRLLLRLLSLRHCQARLGSAGTRKYLSAASAETLLKVRFSSEWLAGASKRVFTNAKAG